MKDFNNTFISTEHLTPEQLTSLYSKYATWKEMRPLTQVERFYHHGGVAFTKYAR